MELDRLNKLIDKMIEKKLNISFAESMTAGNLVGEFAKGERAGKALKGGVVVYTVESKTELLGVSSSTIEKHTAESQQVTGELAIGLKKLMKTDVAVAITGLASNGGSEDENKPVGTVFISIIFREENHEYKKYFPPSQTKDVNRCKEEVISCTTNFVIEELERLLMK
jgi:nicotinamide-nucleotide amidase